MTTDIIVGFPGETEDEWQQTMETVESIGFGHIHIFSFSPREGTKAARLPNPVADDIVRQRSQQLHALADKMKQAIMSQQLGKQLDVLWESPKAVAGSDTIRYTGYTPNFLRVETMLDNGVILENMISKTRLNGISPDNGLLQGSVL